MSETPQIEKRRSRESAGCRIRCSTARSSCGSNGGPRTSRLNTGATVTRQTSRPCAASSRDGPAITRRTSSRDCGRWISRPVSMTGRGMPGRRRSPSGTRRAANGPGRAAVRGEPVSASWPALPARKPAPVKCCSPTCAPSSRRRTGPAALASRFILDKLNAMEGRPWGEWSRGKELSAHGPEAAQAVRRAAPINAAAGWLKPQRLPRSRSASVVRRLSDRFLRYPRCRSETSKQSPETNGFLRSGNETHEYAVSDLDRTKPYETRDCFDVSDLTPPHGETEPIPRLHRCLSRCNCPVPSARAMRTGGGTMANRRRWRPRLSNPAGARRGAGGARRLRDAGGRSSAS